MYDVHSDGSGRCYSSPRRPILNLKPDWKSGRRDAYRHLAADLYIPTWLESLGILYHVTTDHVVNKEGAAALEGYSVVLTGTHPEYISRPIIDAMHAHLDTGGCLLYLGGNGYVRADLVVTEHAAGGFVFATGSISWVQSMAVGQFDNDVARTTENALRAALARTQG